MFKTLRLTIALGLLGVLSAAAAGDGMIVPVRPDIRVRGSWAVKYHHVNITVRDQVASVTIDQEFINTGRGMIEVEYFFPVPPDAAIDAMTMVVNGKEFKGRLLKADEARKIYEDIVRRKKDPALLEYAGFGLYRTKAFPLEPNKPCKIVVHYNNVCKKDGDLVEVWYPLNTEKFSARPIESVKVSVDIKSKADLTNVYSPTHDLSIKRKGPRHVIATYKAEKTLPTIDFQVYYKAANEAVGATLLTHQPDAKKHGYFVLLVSPNPRSGGAQKAIPKDVVVVFDHSGSMAGDKIAQAEDALAFILKNLNKKDRFNVVAYNDSVEPFFESLVDATGGKVAEALDQLDRLDAGGGTAIHEALQVAMGQWAKKAGDNGRPKYAIFLTDGLPTVGKTPEHRSEKKILTDTKKANTCGARIFAFGVGYDVNVRLLDKLAMQNQGRSDYIKESEPVEQKISSLYAKIKNPVMTNLRVRIEGVKLTQMYPQTMGDLFDGDQILLVGRYDGTDVGKLKKRDGLAASQLVVTGNYEGAQRGFEYPVTFRPPGRKAVYGFVERLWAMRRIGFLLDQVQLNGQNKELIDELVHLSQKYGIITPYTSFLADETARTMTQPERRSKAGEHLKELSKVDGVAGQRHAMNRQELREAQQAAPAGKPGANGRGGVTEYGHAEDEAYDKGKSTRSHDTVRNVGNQTIYRRGRVWVTPGTEKLDLEKDADKIQTVERYSDEYFELIRQNTTEENQVLSSQRTDEELLITLRGQVYLVK